MKYLNLTRWMIRRLITLMIATWLLGSVGAGAATLTWDSATTAGIQSGSGIWNFDSAARWTTDGGATNVTWSNNGDIAVFQLTAAGSQTLTINSTSGTIGVAGLVFTGSNGTNTTTLAGSQIVIGTNGIVNTESNYLSITAPVVLGQSQTWSTTTGVANSNAAGMSVKGAISSASGTTNLVLDGRGLGNGVSTGNSDIRQTISFTGANAYKGSTTIVGGVVLRLDYGSDATSKLDDTSALVLAGGTISLNSGTGVSEVVGSTVVSAGANTFMAGSSGGGGTKNNIQLGTITHKGSGTMDVSSAVSSLVFASNANTNGILGGWATMGGGSWASVSSTGAIVSASDNSRSTVASWVTGENVNATGGGTFTGDKTVNALRTSGSTALSLNQGGYTLTISSGGIIGGNSAGTTLTNGTLVSGESTGALYVHARYTTTIGSKISDSSATSTMLVKAGTNSLVLTGANNYSGGTYINSGTLVVASGSSAGHGSVTVQGGAVFDVSADGYTVASGNALAGGGKVLGNVTVASGGHLTPKVNFANDTSTIQSVTGTLTLTNNLTFNDGSILDLDLGSNSSLISLTGTAVTLTGATTDGSIILNVADAGGLAVGTTYTLIQWQSDTVLSGFDLTDFTLKGVDGTLLIANNSLELVVTAVPEPTTWALLFSAVAVLLMGRRRRAA
jgi:autotransporter-associated beta strand protein